MFKSITASSIIAIVAAALVAGLMIVLTSVVPEAKAESQGKGAPHQSHTKRDRLPALAKGYACSQSGWPHYEQICQFDLRRSASEAWTVRIIALR
jgi:hypothetical protein